MDKQPVIIAYRGEDKDVMWNLADEPDQYSRISGRLTDFIVNGNITEVLEYYHGDGRGVGARCKSIATGHTSVWFHDEIETAEQADADAS